MYNKNDIIITGWGSISPLGSNPNDFWKNYMKGQSKIKINNFDSIDIISASLAKYERKIINSIRSENKQYSKIDNSTLMAIFSARNAINMSGWRKLENIGISIGSSRGATRAWEKSYDMMLLKGKVLPITSPITTMGNLSSWVSQDLSIEGPTISHSMTCTSGLHAIANGLAWLKSNMCNKFLCGATEDPLTSFTYKQFEALGLYTKNKDFKFPCRPFAKEQIKQNTLVLGQGSAVFALEKYNDHHFKHIIAKIAGIGLTVDKITTMTSISKNGVGLEKSMLIALEDAQLNDVDAIIAHAPGTIYGDSSELNAIYRVFGDSNHPIILSNKWLIGHTLGASVSLSLELAIHILHNQNYMDFPYRSHFNTKFKKINKIMINAAGFGGNCGSVIISRY